MPRFRNALLLWFCTSLLAAHSHAAESTVRIVPLAELGVDVELGPPVVVAVSAPDETRWGHHQFPKLSALPKGEILLTYNAGADDNAAYGHPGPAYVSRDGGTTWQKYAGEPALAISHSPVSAIGNGEFLCLPFAPGIDVRALANMPQPCGKYFCYAPRNYYRLAELPPTARNYLQDLAAYRWTPATDVWKKETLHYEDRDALAWTSEQGKQSILSRTSFEYPLFRAADELYYADFKWRYANRDGSIPRGMVVTCMASRDNGRTWERRGIIGADEVGSLHFGEGSLAETPEGKLVAVLRSTCEKEHPLWIAWSADRGQTWTERHELWPRGVLPVLQRLESGPLVLAFGRPGLQLSISIDAASQVWSQPLDVATQSCGYSGLIPLDRHTLLLAYSDFKHATADGKKCKAILVRKVKVRTP